MNHTPTPWTAWRTTSPIWIEDANGKRIVTIRPSEFDADIADCIVRDRNAHDALVAALRKVIKCDEKDHANPAAYAKAMQAVVVQARAALANVQAPEQARAA